MGGVYLISLLFVDTHFFDSFSPLCPHGGAFIGIKGEFLKGASWFPIGT